MAFFATILANDFDPGKVFHSGETLGKRTAGE